MQMASQPYQLHLVGRLSCRGGDILTTNLLSQTKSRPIEGGGHNSAGKLAVQHQTCRVLRLPPKPREATQKRSERPEVLGQSHPPRALVAVRSFSCAFFVAFGVPYCTRCLFGGLASYGHADRAYFPGLQFLDLVPVARGLQHHHSKPTRFLRGVVVTCDAVVACLRYTVHRSGRNGVGLDIILLEYSPTRIARNMNTGPGCCFFWRGEEGARYTNFSMKAPICLISCRPQAGFRFNLFLTINNALPCAIKRTGERIAGGNHVGDGFKSVYDLAQLQLNGGSCLSREYDRLSGASFFQATTTSSIKALRCISPLGYWEKARPTHYLPFLSIITIHPQRFLLMYSFRESNQVVEVGALC